LLGAERDGEQTSLLKPEKWRSLYFSALSAERYNCPLCVLCVSAVNYYDFSIRRATSDDIPAMCGLFSELFSIESDFSPDREKQARGLELLLSDAARTSIIFVADRGEEIIGMCSVN